MAGTSDLEKDFWTQQKWGNLEAPGNRSGPNIAQIRTSARFVLNC